MTRDKIIDAYMINSKKVIAEMLHGGKLSDTKYLECFKGVGQYHEQHMYDECEMYSDKDFYCSEWEAKK